MDKFIEKYRERIAGTLSGFDRLVLRGAPRRLNHAYFDQTRKVMVAKGMEEFLWQNEIAFKSYGDYVKKISERVKKASTKPFHEAGLPVIYFPEAADKEEYARQLAAQKGITSGPVCIFSVMEP